MPPDGGLLCGLGVADLRADPWLFYMPITSDASIAVLKLMDALSSFEHEVFKSLAMITNTQEPTEQTKEIKNIYSLFIPSNANIDRLIHAKTLKYLP